MKRTPHLDFVYDNTTERAARLTRLIDEAVGERAEEHAE
jgi:ribosome-binding factor A